MIEDKDINFLKKLKDYPHLRKRFEEILNATDSEDIITADDTEEKAIEETRKLGQEMLQEWACKQEGRQISKAIESIQKLRNKELQKARKEDSINPFANGFV